MNKEDSILFLGDVIPYKAFKFHNSYKTVFNLECPITAKGKPVTGKINLKVSKNYLKNIFGGNMLCTCISNNHILDYGNEGLQSTLSELKKIELSSFGLNAGDENICTPLVIDFNNIKVAFFAVVCTTTSPVTQIDNKVYLNVLNPDAIITSIKKIKASVQRVILYIHWGEEESSYPTKKDTLIARKLIDEGVDIIIGSHAHAPQSIEKYNNGIIAYNLGNFIMPAMKKVPSYFDKSGIPLSSFTKKIMFWNRVSWGIVIDIKNLEYKIKKFIFLFNRIIELRFTPFDKYIQMNKHIFDSSYEQIFKSHLKKRALYRKLIFFVTNPYIPQRIKKFL